MIIKSILITHPLNFDCRITNNPPCIVYEHLIGITITGRFSKWGRKSKYRVCHVQGQENCSHWLDTVMDWRSLPEAGRFKTLLRSIPPQLGDPCYCSTVSWSLIMWYVNAVFSNASVDQNWKMNFISFFEFFENCDRNNKRSLIYFFEKNDDKWHIRNIHIKYKIIIIIQYKISEDVVLLLNITRIMIKCISITHPLVFYCRITNKPPFIIYQDLIELTIICRFSKWGHQFKYRVKHI